jgi:hypothetical protein
MFTSYLSVANFERIMEKCTRDELARMEQILSENPSDRDFLRTLNRDFDLQGKGFNAYGFPFHEALPEAWDYVVPALKTDYDVYKHFPVITDKQGEGFIIRWHSKKYNDRFEQDNECPEDFEYIMTSRLMAALEFGNAFVVLPARNAGDICFIVPKDVYSAPAVATADPAVVKAVVKAPVQEPAQESVDERLVNPCDDIASVASSEWPEPPAAPSNMDLVQSFLLSVKDTYPIVWKKISDNTLEVNVNVKILLQRKANVDDTRRKMLQRLQTCTLLKVIPNAKGEERANTKIVVKA